MHSTLQSSSSLKRYPSYSSKLSSNTLIFLSRSMIVVTSSTVSDIAAFRIIYRVTFTPPFYSRLLNAAFFSSLYRFTDSAIPYTSVSILFSSSSKYLSLSLILLSQSFVPVAVVLGLCSGPFFAPGPYICIDLISAIYSALIFSVLVFAV